MQWDYTIKVTDLAIVFATLLGPVFAVQAQVVLEKRREKRARRSGIFHALMRTRAANIAQDHVQALNAIPIEFYGVERVTNAFKAYVTHLYAPQTNPTAWIERRVDLFMDLLWKVGREVGYQFDVAQLKSEFYAPVGHQTVENEQTAIRQGLAKVLSGQASLPMEVTKMPSDPEAQAALKALLKGETALKIKPDVPPQPQPPQPAR